MVNESMPTAGTLKIIRDACLIGALLGCGPVASADTPPAKAPTDPVLEEMKPCESGADPAARAVACTQLITSGKLKGRALGAAYVFRGKAQAQRNEIKAAIIDFSEALKINPMATDALYNRGAAYALSGQTNYALA